MYIYQSGIQSMTAAKSVNVNHLQQTSTLLFSSVVLQHYRNVTLETITAEGKIGLQYAVQTTTASD